MTTPHPRRTAAPAAVAAFGLVALLAAPAPAAEGDEALRDRIDGLLRRRDPVAAVAEAARAQAERPDDGYRRHCLGWALLEAGRAAEALPHLEAAVAAAAADARAQDDLGCALMALGRLDDAGAAFDRAALLDPGLAATRNNMGVLLEKRGRGREAEAAFREALARDPSHPQANNNLGALLLESGRPDEALGHLAAALAADPSYASPVINLGVLALARGDDAEAERRLRDAAGRPDARPEAHFDLALVAMRRRDWDLARASLERALALLPEHPDVLNNLGVVHLLAREPRAAEGYLTRAVAARPDFAQAWSNLGLALHHLAAGADGDAKLMARSEAAYRRETELRPDGPWGHYNLGSVLLLQGKVPEATASLRRAIALAPAHAEALNNLGVCLSLSADERKGDPAAALACYLEALRVAPDYADAHRSLAEFYADTEGWRDFEKARFHWREYARHSPGDEAARREAERAIAELKNAEVEANRRRVREGMQQRK